LKYYCGLSRFEQEVMTAEDRKWWINRIKEEKQRESQSYSSKGPQNIPGKPI